MSFISAALEMLQDPQHGGLNGVLDKLNQAGFGDQVKSWIGTGANLPWVRRALPPGLPVEIWGLDLSEGMLSVCRDRLAAQPDPSVRLVMGDVHALPFAGVLPRLHDADSVEQLAQLAAAEMKRLSGFGRCLVYRFD